MALTRSFPTQHPSGLPITDTRRVTAGLVARNADGTPRPGVFPAHTNPLVTGRASMGYDVAPFVAATSRINTGVELVANDAVTVVPTTAAPAANSRIDVIWVRSQFVQHADANNDVVFGVAQGAAAPVPTKPAIPAGALELATAEILSTTTTTAAVVITQTHPFTSTAGSVVPFRNAVELLAWTAPNGAEARDLSTGLVYERSGGAWVVSQPGSTLIVPSSVSGTGLTVSPKGEVVATNMPTAGGNIEGIFSSRFRTYEMAMEGTFSGNSAVQVQLRNAGGTDATASAYLNQYIWSVAGGAASTTQNNLTLFAQSATGATRFSSRLRFSNPAIAVPTGYLAECSALAGTSITQTRMAGFHTPGTAYSGITISTTSGASFTGTIKIYGIA